MMREGFVWAEGLEAAHRLSDPALSLEKGAAIIDAYAMGKRGSDLAAEDDDCDYASWSMDLATMADEVATLARSSSLPRVASGAHPASEAISLVTRVMIQDWGFAGNHDDYYNADNSLLSRVIESRRGIPITLGVVFASIAERATTDVRFRGTGFPGHFLLRADGSDDREAPSSSLEGDWVGQYGAHGPELVRIRQGSDGTYIATKLTGDPNVPAGETSFKFWESEAGCYEGVLVVAGEGFVEPRELKARVKATGTAQLEVEEQGVAGIPDLTVEPLRLRRLCPTEPIFIDVFHGGRILLTEHCVDMLGGTTGEEGNDENGGHLSLAPVENVAVFRRMANNLNTCYTKGGERSAASRWNTIAAALQPRDGVLNL